MSGKSLSKNRLMFFILIRMQEHPDDFMIEFTPGTIIYKDALIN